MKQLSKGEMKKVMGGKISPTNQCNVYCGTGSGGSCDTTCPSCVDAGNGKGTGPGQDKLCAR